MELKENLIMELEERKKHVEGERQSMELTGSECSNGSAGLKGFRDF